MDIISKEWPVRMLNMAKEVASWSKDDSTKVGAVITTLDGRPVSWAFNGFPMGINDDVAERKERPLKYKWTCHAERNAMDLSSKLDLSDCVMFVTFFPCSNCAQSIVQRGIKTLVVDAEFSAERMPERWQEDMLVSKEMLDEAKVNIIEVDLSASVDAPPTK